MNPLVQKRPLNVINVVYFKIKSSHYTIDFYLQAVDNISWGHIKRLPLKRKKNNFSTVINGIAVFPLSTGTVGNCNKKICSTEVFQKNLDMQTFLECFHSNDG